MFLGNTEHTTTSQLKALMRVPTDCHIWIAYNDKGVSDKVLKFWLVLAPLYHVDIDGNISIVTADFCIDELAKRKLDEDKRTTAEAMETLTEIINASERLQKFWIVSKNIVEFIEMCMLYLDRNVFYVECADSTLLKRYYYDIATDGEYVTTADFYQKYNGRTENKVNLKIYEKTALTYARQILLYDFYVTHKFPYDDHPNNYTHLVPFSASAELSEWLLDRICY